MIHPPALPSLPVRVRATRSQFFRGHLVLLRKAHGSRLSLVQNCSRKGDPVKRRSGRGVYHDRYSEGGFPNRTKQPRRIETEKSWSPCADWLVRRLPHRFSKEYRECRMARMLPVRLKICTLPRVSETVSWKAEASGWVWEWESLQPLFVWPGADLLGLRCAPHSESLCNQQEGQGGGSLRPGSLSSILNSMFSWQFPVRSMGTKMIPMPFAGALTTAPSR